jgi:pyruvate,water dikinase
MKDKFFDNSNIAESYAGVTTPLTFSFVRHVYQGVYTYFCKMMGVNNKTIKENKEMFRHMVEFIGYRIYYDLGNWYKMLSFFPGYKFSSRFMEKMMGVEKEFNNTESQKDNFLQKYFIYLPKTLLLTFKISLSFFFLGIRMKRFNKYFDKIFSKINSTNLKQLSLKELQNLYTELNNKLLSRWRVPIANDFAVMVSAGLADKLFKKWLKSDDAYLHMHPKTNKPLVSLDPGNRVNLIVEEIKKDQEIYKLFQTNNEEEILKLLSSRYSTHQTFIKIDDYLKEFGSRIPSELKLESETLIEKPEDFIKLVKNIVHNNEITSTKVEKIILRQNNFKNLNFIKSLFLRWLLRWAGNSIQRREEARFRRALIFGHARKIFIAIGEKLQQKQCVVVERDVFYLTIEEIFDFIEGNEKDPIIILDLIKHRKKEYQTWGNKELPRRIETQKSLVEIENKFLSEGVEAVKTAGQLRGRVASQPIDVKFFSGTALTLPSFDPDANFKDKILVTCQTDPGWTMVFPFLKGLVVERGGMLSHAAIVARELNIPCIVGVENATAFIIDGTGIKLDLQDGRIYTI